MEADDRMAAAFPAFLERLGRGRPLRRPPGDERAWLEACWQTPLPPELAAVVDWRDRVDTGSASVGEWRAFAGDVWLPDRASGTNVVEQAILVAQQAYLSTVLVELCTGCVWLGSLGNGDGYLAHLDHREPERAEVVFWDHEERWITGAIADSPSTLAWAVTLLDRVASAGEDDTPEPDAAALAADHARLAGRFTPSWHFGSLTRIGRDALPNPPRACPPRPPYEETGFARYYLARASWILALLRDRDPGERELRGLFGLVDHHPSPILEQVLENPFLSRSPITAFYWLWRLFWFDRDADLLRCLAVCLASPSPTVRALAELVRDLREGRNTLGILGDVRATRARFMALDLDPDRAEARAAEAAAAAERKAAQDDADRARAAVLAGSDDPDALVDAAWGAIGNDLVLGPLLDRLLALRPELAPDARRLAYVRANGHDRDGCSYGDERDDVIEALSHADPALAPWLLSGPRDLWPAAAGSGDRRAFDVLAGRIDADARWLHDAGAAVEALGVLGDPRAVPVLEGFAARLVPGDDFASRLRVKDATRATVVALARLGGGVDAIRSVARSSGAGLRARALHALGLLGDPAGLPEAVAGFGGETASAAAFALGHVRHLGGLDALGAEVAWLRGAPERLVFVRLMAAAAADRAGLPVDLDLVRLALQVIEPTAPARVELHVTALRLLAAHAPADERTAALRLALDDEDRAVREVALGLLADHGTPVTPVWCDRATVDHVFAERGADGLRALLEHPDAVFRHEILRKAADTGTGDRLGPALAEVVRARTRFPWYGHGYVKDGLPRLDDVLESLVAFGTDEARALLLELAAHPNVAVRSSDALKHAELGERPPTRRPPPFPGGARVALAAEPVGKAPWLHGSEPKGLAFTPDGGRLLAVSDGGSAIHDGDGHGVPLPGVLAGRRGFDVAVSPDGRLAAIASHGGHVDLVDLEDLSVVRALRGHRGVPCFVARVAFSPSGARVATVSNDHTLQVWEVANGVRIGVLEATCDLNAVAWLDDDTVAYAGDRVIGTARADGTALARADAVGIEVCALPDGRLAFGCQREIRIVDRDLRELARWKQARCLRLRVTPDGRGVFALSYEGADRGLWCWDRATGKRKKWAGGPDGVPRALAVHPRTGLPVVGGPDPRLWRWDAKRAQIPSAVRLHVGEVAAIAVVDGVLHTLGEHGGLLRWRGETAELVCETGPSRATGFAFSADRATIAIATGDAALVVEATTGEERVRIGVGRCEAVVADACFVFGSGRALRFVGFGGEDLGELAVIDDSWIHHVLPLGPGHVLVSGYRAATLQVVDVVARRIVGTWTVPDRGRADTYGLAVGAGRFWASRWDHSVEIVPIPSAPASPGVFRERLVLTGPCAPIVPSPDGRWLAVGEWPLALVEVATGAVAAEHAPPAGITAIAWVDAATLVYGTKTGRVVRVGIT